MRAGGGKLKGVSFERDVCKKLSLWATHGKRNDCFWRSAMSGGRATVANRKGAGLVNRHGGDISAVASEGHWLTQEHYIECKHYADLNIASFMIKAAGKLADFWETTCNQSARYNRSPVLIAKQNNYPTLFITQYGHGHFVMYEQRSIAHIFGTETPCVVFLFDRLVLYRCKHD